MLTIKLNQFPKLKQIVRQVGSAKQSAFIRITDRVAYSGTFWDSGSRSVYTAVNLTTGRTERGPQFDPPQFGGPNGDPRVNLPAGFAIVEHGTFCGKPSTPSIYLHPLDSVTFGFVLVQGVASRLMLTE